MRKSLTKNNIDIYELQVTIENLQKQIFHREDKINIDLIKNIYESTN